MPPHNIPEAILTTLEVAQEKQYSTVEAYRDTIQRLGGIGITEDDPYMRSLIIYSVATRDPMVNFADELLKNGLREDIGPYDSSGVEISDQNIELDPVTKNQIMDSIDNISYSDCVKPKARGYVDMDGLSDSLDNLLSGDAEQNQAVLRIYMNLISENMLEIEYIIDQEIRSTFTELQNILENDPTEDDWAKAYRRLAELTAKFDEGVRYWGDLR